MKIMSKFMFMQMTKASNQLTNNLTPTGLLMEKIGLQVTLMKDKRDFINC